MWSAWTSTSKPVSRGLSVSQLCSTVFCSMQIITISNKFLNCCHEQQAYVQCLEMPFKAEASD